MSAFTMVAGRAPARLLALAVLSTLAAQTITIAPAMAQQKEAKQPTRHKRQTTIFGSRRNSVSNTGSARSGD